ncbi:multiple epidermal growth factor-like domains protein 11 [Haliotis rubra]|uniref:multiple epidermal growth factor-like domains protein 11 n=1 Tax=Haliotis rubra TaxID=36100 RepID=UPI001EE5A249|nr:multiple epidermal growth factor-like domains protein 11 [Haliotis rubra]
MTATPLVACVHAKTDTGVNGVTPRAQLDVLNAIETQESVQNASKASLGQNVKTAASARIPVTLVDVLPAWKVFGQFLWAFRECLHGCKVGYFGTLCKLKCSTSCKNRQCHRVNGNCTDGCEPGVYGPQCNTNCTNCINNQCHEGTGECNGCETGYYGWRCDKKCSIQCSGRSCDRYEGTCVFRKPSHESTTSSQDVIMTTNVTTTTPDPVTVKAVVITVGTLVTVCTVITVFIFISKRITMKGLDQSTLRRRPQYPAPPPPDATHHYEVIDEVVREYDAICPSNSAMCRPAQYEDINEISPSNRKPWADKMSPTKPYPCQNTERADVNKSPSSSIEMHHTTESLSLPNLSFKSGYIPMTSLNTYLTITGDRRNSTP